jgi:hypothetical protein
MIRLAFALILITGASVCPTGAPDPREWRIVYGDEAWYRERNEAEHEWRGTLRPRAVIEGPNARTAVRFDLMTDDGAFAVYAPTNALDDLANESVIIRGKLVDLGEADRGVEIWSGAIARVQ